MKVLITIFIGLMVEGCGKEQFTYTKDSNNTPQNSDNNNLEKETSSKDADSNWSGWLGPNHDGWVKDFKAPKNGLNDSTKFGNSRWGRAMGHLWSLALRFISTPELVKKKCFGVWISKQEKSLAFRL